MKNPHNDLIKIAAQLTRGEPLCGLSSYPEDMPKTTPKSVLYAIEYAEDRLKQLALDIVRAADQLKSETK